MLRPSLLKVIAEKHDIGKKHFLFSGHFDRYQRNYYLQIGSYRNQLALTKVSKEQKHGRNKARIIQVSVFEHVFFFYYTYENHPKYNNDANTFIETNCLLIPNKEPINYKNVIMKHKTLAAFF